MSRSAASILIAFCVLVLFAAYSDGAACYSYNGLEWPDQQLCPGSDACCGARDTCMPNRLCKSPDSRDNVLVRGTCLSYPWDRSACAQICVFNETFSNTGFGDNVFPRVEICDSNTYCCRQGGESCCDASIGKVYLDDNGILLSAAPSQSSSTEVVTPTSTSTETTSTAATSSATVFATTTSAPTQDPVSTSPASESSAAADEPRSGSNEALALKVGLGVGIPLAAIVAGLASWLIFKRRRNKNRNATELHGTAAYPHYDAHDGYAKGAAYRNSPHTAYRSPSPPGLNEMHEMPARPHEGWDGHPRELAGSELQAGRYR